jgi:hypothetical protein
MCGWVTTNKSNMMGKCRTSKRERRMVPNLCCFRRKRSKKMKNARRIPHKDVRIRTKPDALSKAKQMPIEVDELEFEKKKAIYDEWSRNLESLQSCQIPHKDISVRTKPEVDSKVKEHNQVELLKKEKVIEVAAVNSQLESCWNPYKDKAVKTQVDCDDKMLQAKMVERGRMQ